MITSYHSWGWQVDDKLVQRNTFESAAAACKAMRERTGATGTDEELIIACTKLGFKLVMVELTIRVMYEVNAVTKTG